MDREKSRTQSPLSIQERKLRIGKRVICHCEGRLLELMLCLQSTRGIVVAKLHGNPREELFIDGSLPNTKNRIDCQGSAKMLRAQIECAIEGTQNLAKNYTPD